jgi:predicted LPLAT superfamily acyltransferase
MAATWEQQHERSNPLMLSLILWIARVLGRGTARLLLFPIVGYFLLTGGSAKRASRDYLRRVLEREPRWIDLARHFHTFASVMLDRFFLVTGNTGAFDVRFHRPPEVEAIVRQKRGCLLLLAHLGGFEIMRVTGSTQRKLPLRVLMDLAHNRMFVDLIQKLDPGFRQRVIDASQRGPALALALKQALDEGAMVGMMADRARADERAVAASFLGDAIRLPAGPWIFAGMLDVPVILAFGLYRGGKRYDVHFELMAEQVDLPRASREQALQHYAQQYADRLAHYARLAPYNWFNFYDYWQIKP